MTILDIIVEISLPATSLTFDYRAGRSICPASLNRRHLRIDTSHFIAVGEHLEELTLSYSLDTGVVFNWTLGFLLHVPKLRKLDLTLDGIDENYSFFHHLVSAEFLWPQLQELRLASTWIGSEDLTALLQKCRQSLRVLNFEHLRVSSSIDTFKTMFRTLSTDLALDTVKIKSLRSHRSTRASTTRLVHFPALSENPIIDESWETKFEFQPAWLAGGWRNATVNYSGAKMDVALDILARTIEFA